MHAKIHSWVRSNPVEALGTWIQPTGGGREPTLEDIVSSIEENSGRPLRMGRQE